MTHDTRLTPAHGDHLRELCRPNSESYEASIRIALEAAGIPAVYQTSTGFADARSVILVPQDDHDRAREVIAGLQNTTDLNEPEGPVFRRIRWIAGTVIALTVLRGMWMIFSR